MGKCALCDPQKEYNDFHGFYRAHIEHLFAWTWHWGIIRNLWRGCGTDLHEYMHVLLPLQQFLSWGGLGWKGYAWASSGVSECDASLSHVSPTGYNPAHDSKKGAMQRGARIGTYRPPLRYLNGSGLSTPPTPPLGMGTKQR